MTPFEWLVIGHFIGDWAFQNDWMVRHKQNGLFNRAVFVHCAIYTSVLLSILFSRYSDLYNLSEFILFAVIVGASHWLIDATNAASRWMDFFQQSKVLYVRIVVDQIFHLLILGLLAQWLFG
jgi:hypothetical protein